LKSLTYFYLLFLFFLGLKGNAQGLFERDSPPISEGFVENLGQIMDQNQLPNNQVLFLLNASHYNIQLRKGGFSYDTYRIEALKNEEALTDSSQVGLPNRYHFHRVDVEFINAELLCRIEGEEAQEDPLNYILPDQKEIYGIKTYKKVTYHNLYPNIDLEFVVENGKPKFNFIVNQGGNIEQIRWKYLGAKAQIQNGKIELELHQSKFVEDLPRSYYAGDEHNEELSIQYLAFGEGLFGFKSKSKLNSQQKLIIDPVPVLEYATYYTNPVSTVASDICTDNLGNVYFAGEVGSALNMATTGAYQTTFTGTIAGYYAKFNAANQRVYATIYANLSTIKIKCDAHNNVVLLGTGKGNIASPGAYLTAVPNPSAGFLARFTMNGQRLWATYIKYSAWGKALAINSKCNITVVGNTTNSDSGFVTPGCYQPYPSLLLNEKSYLIEFDSNGNKIYGTFIGSDNITRAEQICIDKDDNIIVAGKTTGNLYMGTPGTYKPSMPAGHNSVFILKFNAAGQKLWGTYFGEASSGAFYPWPGGIDCDVKGCIYLAGTIFSQSTINYLATPGVFQSLYNANNEGYVIKFNPNGTRKWGTFYGGNSSDEIRAVRVHPNGRVYIAGNTRSTNVIASSNALQDSLARINSSQNPDVFIASLDSNGQRVFGTYYGSWADEICGKLDVDVYGKIVMNIRAGSYNGMYTSPNAFQSVSSDYYYSTMYLKFSDCVNAEIPQITVSDSLVCPGDSIELNIMGDRHDASHWYVYYGGSFLSMTDTNTLRIPVMGNNTFALGGKGGCVSYFNPITFQIPLDSIPEINAGMDTAVCLGQSILLNATGTALQYGWMNGAQNGDTLLMNEDTLLVAYGIGNNGCKAYDSLKVDVLPLPNVQYVSSISQMCIYNAPYFMQGGSPIGGSYEGPGVVSNILFPDSSGLGNHLYSYHYTDSMGCTQYDTAHILVSECVGINSHEGTEFIKVYPNPSHGMIYIEGINSQSLFQMTLMDVNGRVVKEISSLNRSKVLVDLSRLEAGVYSYQIIQNGEILHGKILRITN